MKSRCYNPKVRGYNSYGGRGVKVCEMWIESFDNFFKDMGLRPSDKHSLDRFPDKNGDYEPTNCRWALPKQQGRNRRTNSYVTYNGETLCIIEWSEKLNISYEVLQARKRNNWTPERMLTTPVNKTHNKKV